MPEKPEVITVSKTLEKIIIGKTIKKADVYHDNIIIGDVEKFKKDLVGEKIESITTRGKWIVIFLTTKALIVHLRMEGKFFFRNSSFFKSKHEHVIITFTDNTDMRFNDVRKFGKMACLPKKEVFNIEPLASLGLEYNDKNLTPNYLVSALKQKRIPIKTSLLDQSIITGIGNIYDDEILFLSHINPLRKSNTISLDEANAIIKNTSIILKKAIKMGGTTIKSFTSAEGVHGLFQNELLVHGKKDGLCPICNSKISVIKIGGRSTYFCPNCQK